METKMSFVDVASDNIRQSIAIPIIWLISVSTSIPIIGKNCEWYLPFKNLNKKAAKCSKVEKQWKKDFGRVNKVNKVTKMM